LKKKRGEDNRGSAQKGTSIQQEKKFIVTEIEVRERDRKIAAMVRNQVLSKILQIIPIPFVQNEYPIEQQQQ
jgi:hypothetical protein